MTSRREDSPTMPVRYAQARGRRPQFRGPVLPQRAQGIYGIVTLPRLSSANTIKSGSHPNNPVASNDQGVAKPMLEFNDSKLHETLATGNWTDQKNKELIQDQWVMMAVSYKKAADLLVDGQAKSLLIGAEQQYIACPIMFLYRHFLEISLKGLMVDLQTLGKQGNPLIAVDHQILNKGLPGHPLMQAWLPVRQLLVLLSTDQNQCAARSEEPSLTYNAIEARIREFDEIDEGSFSYRYPIDRKNNPTLGPLPREGQIRKVRDVVETIEVYFGGFRSWIHDYRTAMMEDRYF